MMNKHTHAITLFCALLASSLAISAFAAEMGVVSIRLPAEQAQFKPGPGVEVVRKNCLVCHSADYVYMQPPLTKAQWSATVAKMKKAMGASIDDGDIDTIVGYLMSQNGKS
jgi:cytochrome c5